MTHFQIIVSTKPGSDVFFQTFVSISTICLYDLSFLSISLLHWCKLRSLWHWCKLRSLWRWSKLRSLWRGLWHVLTNKMMRNGQKFWRNEHFYEIRAFSNVLSSSWIMTRQKWQVWPKITPGQFVLCNVLCNRVEMAPIMTRWAFLLFKLWRDDYDATILTRRKNWKGLTVCRRSAIFLSLGEFLVSRGVFFTGTLRALGSFKTLPPCK